MKTIETTQHYIKIFKAYKIDDGVYKCTRSDGTRAIATLDEIINAMKPSAIREFEKGDPAELILTLEWTTES